MATSYPGALDAFPNPTSSDLVENATANLDHHAQHTNANDAVEAVQAELGTDPAGGQATVKARLTVAAYGALAGVVPLYTTGRWYDGQRSTDGPASNAIPQDAIIYTPFWSGAGVTLDRIALYVSSASGSGSARLGIYNASATTGLPSGSPLLDAGTVSTSTTGSKEITISQALTADTLYWLAYVANQSASGYGYNGSGGAGGSPTNYGYAASSGDDAMRFIYQDFTYAALPTVGTLNRTTSAYASARVRIA